MWRSDVVEHYLLPPEYMDILYLQRECAVDAPRIGPIYPFEPCPS